MSRNPAVAGKFYNSSSQGLREEVKKYIIHDAEKHKVKAAIVPHAGFVYSGKVAGAVYSQIGIGDTVIIIGPNHTGIGEPDSIITKGDWQMPNGSVSIDEELAEEIFSRSSYLKADDLSHVNEHSIEVQLPFLQYLFPDFKIVPIVVGSFDLEVCKDVGNAISESVKNIKKSVTLIASTDMTHYESHEAALNKDEGAMKCILSMDPGGLFEYIHTNDLSMCGAASTITVLQACNNMGDSSVKLVKYMTSGEVNGDYSNVVGYAGLIIY